MRILVLTPTFLPVVGGAELVILEIYRRLAGRHEVRLLTPHLDPSLLAQQASDEYDSLVNFPVTRYRDRVSFMQIRGHRLSRGAIPPFSVSALMATRRAVREWSPDVLNIHYLIPTGLAGVLAERCLGIPTVLTLNGRDAPGPGVPPLWGCWQRALLNRVSDATYVSAYCRQALYGRRPPRGQVIYNGIEIPPPPGDGEEIRRGLAVPPREPLIFALQRLAPEKRVDVLVRAMRRCVDHLGGGTLLIGGKGPEERALRALAADLGIADRVRFAGYIPRHDLGSYFLASDLFAFHSTFETFGLVLAQAMSYGRAVVSVRNTAIPEIVGEAGLLVDTGDWQAFGDAMAALLRDDVRRKRLGDSGREYVAAHFNWDRIAEQYEAVLMRAAAGRTRAHSSPLPAPR
jgi:glycosyltransferase involved in cell wall biosynthesis